MTLNLFNRFAKKNSRQSLSAQRVANKSFSLKLENLDRRELMAASISQSLSDLYIRGTEFNDTVEVGLKYVGVTTGDAFSYGMIPLIYSTVKNGSGTILAESSLPSFSISQIWIFSENGSDTITQSTSKSTYVDSGYGNDVITTSSGNDTILGGYGSDTIDAGRGNDDIYGGYGNDVINAGYGDDSIQGNQGSDTIDAGSGNDWVYGNDGSDLVTGGSGSDTLVGGDGNDTISGGSDNDYILGDNGSDRLSGDEGNDSLYGGSGNDELFAGSGVDWLNGQDGNDTLISIDSDTSDYLYGGNDIDNFWRDKSGSSYDTSDASTTELNDNWMHSVSSFANGADKTLNGDNIADPTDAGTTANFASKPLFATGGPTEQDVDQGSVGDCWLMAGLASMAGTDQDTITKAVVDFGDGTYGVALGGSFYRVDADLPVNSSGNPTYAYTGVDDSIWVAVVEKAYADYRTGANTYASLNSGRCQPVYEAFNNSYYDQTTFADDEVDEAMFYVINNMMAGRSMNTLIKNASSTSSLINNHWFTIEGINWSAETVTLRNPWGDAGSGANNRLVTVAVSEWIHAMSDSNGIETADF